jgi:hypothetical protein
MEKQNITIGFWLPTQVALLILYYGGICPTLPWWLVWFPSLLVLGLLAIFFVIMIIITIAALIFG